MKDQDKHYTNKTVLRRADISARVATVLDLEGRYPQIAESVSRQTGFTLESEIGKSTWWGKKVGAVMYKGQLSLDGRITPAVLKIEGVETHPDEITEVKMIHQAKKALSGSGIRPPKVYLEIPWTTEYDGYSAIIMEDVKGIPVLPVPGTEKDIAAFLKVRTRYRDAFKANHAVPWVTLDLPEGGDYLPQSIKARFEIWKKSSKQTFPDHPFREPSDEALVDRAVDALEKSYAGVFPEFQQGHFSHLDLVTVGSETVMFSNLYWSWRAPFYDAVFAQHWYMYELANVPGITIEQIEEQRKMWNKQYDAALGMLSPADQNLFTLARMERLAAGLNIDALSISEDPSNEFARYLVNQTRKELKSLLS